MTQSEMKPREVPWSSFQAVLFDLDGVITPTADLHRRAWGSLFAPYDFTDDDYLRSVDGKPRYEGVEAFLASRGVELPYGSPEDSPDLETICGLGNRKNAEFNAILERDGVAPYPGTIALLDYLQELSVTTAVVSSSRNANAVLLAAGLGDRFPLVVDGLLAEALGLPGKPEPDTFVHAAHELGATVERTAVIEDAQVGVAAAVTGGFGYVVGVDRGGNRKPLTDAGATIVVEDLANTLEGSR